MDFERGFAGSKSECDEMPIIYHLDNYHDVIARLYPDFDGHSVINITFQVTEDCNLACTYCYQHDKTKKKLSFDDAKTFIDELLSDSDKLSIYLMSSQYKGVIIEFIGGEPFLEIDLISQITDYFVEQLIEKNHPWKYNYRISISSNGILYNTPKVQDYIRKHDSVLSLGITVDGTKELHDKCRRFHDGRPSYDIAHDASLDYKQKHNVDMSKITLSPENISYFSDCMKQMLTDDFDTIHANFVYEKGWEKEHARIFYEQVKDLTDWLIQNHINYFDCDLLFRDLKPMTEDSNQNWCGGDGNMLCISPDGGYYPCLRYSPSSIGCHQKPYLIGTVTNGIGSNQEELDKIHELRSITRRSQSTDECFYCPIADGCGWCSAYNYECFGTANKRATFTCVMHKARHLASVYLNRKLNISGNERFHVRLDETECVDLIGIDNYKELMELAGD